MMTQHIEKKDSVKNQDQAQALKKVTIETPRDKALFCAHAALDKKAENLKALDLSGLSSFTDAFVICSGATERQVQAIANSIDIALGKAGQHPLSIEGYSEGRWVLIDFGDVVVHVFLEALREYYDLDHLWTDAARIEIPNDFYTRATAAN